MMDKFFPKELSNFSPMNARLGVKSSFPNAKRNIALLLLLWFSNGELSTYSFFKNDKSNNNEKIILKKEYSQNLYEYIKDYIDEKDRKYDKFCEKINKFELVQGQIEPSQVAFQIVWRLAEISFEDKGKTDSAERQGGNRFPKVIRYTNNVDLIKYSFIGQDNYLRAELAEWLVDSSDDSSIKFFDESLDRSVLNKSDEKLLKILSVISEKAVIKTKDDDGEIIFQKNGIYQTIAEHDSGVSVAISGNSEKSGLLRIISSAIKDGMEPYLESVDANHVKLKNTTNTWIEEYAKRIISNIKLSNIDVEIKAKEENNSNHGINIGENIIYYGAPGTGKSYGIAELIRKNGIEEYDPKEGSKFVERITLHPDYSYSDFVGQIMPVVRPSSNESNTQVITYDFQPGNFTRALKVAIDNQNSPVFLVVEEMSRANVSAVFGDLFQLLDRDNNGRSEYSISNPLIAKYVYSDSNETNIYLPSNLMIVGTVNTSDQNVFVMDTAFKRRFRWYYVSTNPEPGFKNNPQIIILDANDKCIPIRWKDFLEKLNDFIVNELGMSEDKQIGPYFIKFSEHNSDEETEELIKDKLLKYLWEDVASISNLTSENKLFSSNIKSFSLLYNYYEHRKRIFSKPFLNHLKSNKQDGNNE